ncbi:UbiD family decarboxylase [Amycolatopsis acidiphila]|uniref:UbiD family decarboxylase n=1 Tax=Amycolatopsis acidiphila TaxID=715473 RepID=A0A558A660_9PSEU|nr:UbiD family decarboxylase [Amycolatopsis acidiphila]TVT19732.1 UbiD family decarboxylase [Amycolatopsis acidiphila]UIJ61910.1 UbiD family decarboxylase [Amycolatopsis acidiphila]GHG57210.1 decarboxylase UbiD [Amycolatopsis acidiphila]
MTGTDLREWLGQASEAGELQPVEGASWDLEVGALSQVNYRRPVPKALLFDSIKDYQRGLRVLSGSVSNPRLLGSVLGLGWDCTDDTLMEALAVKPGEWVSRAAEFRAQEVPDGPLLSTVVSKPDVNLLDFPVPRWHEGDGGRYIGTGCAVVTRDYDTGRINLGAYRMQVQDDGASASVNIEAGKQGAQHLRRWFEAEGRAPIAASLGHHPAFLVAAGIEVPGDVSEYDYVGAILGEPVRTVAGQVTGLPLPHDAELAIEGWVRPDNVRPEGPFGEWTGYYSGSREPILTIDIERVYYRENPILLGAPPGKPPHDYSYMRTVMKSAIITDGLRKAGLPGLRGVWAHEAGGGRSLLIVSIEQRYPGHARQAAYLAAQFPNSAYMNRFTVVVDSDVNPRDLGEVMWAMCGRCDPQVDIEVMKRTWGSRVDPLTLPGALAFNSRAVIDACRPFEMLGDFPEVAESSEELVAAVSRRWPEVSG